MQPNQNQKNLDGRVYYDRRGGPYYNPYYRPYPARRVGPVVGLPGINVDPYYSQFGGSFQAQQQQQQPSQQQLQQSEDNYYGGEYGCGYDGDDVIDDDEEYYMTDDYGEEYNYGNGGYGNEMGPTPNQAMTPYVPKPERYLKETTNVKFHTVKYDMERHFTPSQLFGKLNEEGKPILKNNGRLIFSVANRQAVLDRASNKEDFGADQPKGHHDLIKSVKIVDMTSNYKNKLSIAFRSIPSYNGELSRNDTPYVNFTVPAGKLSTDKPVSFEVFKRDITNGVIEYAKAFPGQNPDNMNESIAWITDPTDNNKITHGLVSVNPKCPHPLVHFFNKKYGKGHPNHITGPHIGLEAVQRVMLLKQDIDEFSAQARTKVTTKVSLGDVTNGFICDVSVPVPVDRQANLQKFPFLGFADVKYAYPHKDLSSPHPLNKNTTIEKYHLSEPIKLAFSVEIEYIKLNGKTIVDEYY